MVVKVYISGISGNKEVKKRQQRVLMILDSKNIKYDVIDITEPGREADKDFMQNNSKSNGATVSDPNPRSALPPQVFNEDEYCGDYDQFDLANEIDTLEQFLKVEIPPEEVPQAENGLNGDVNSRRSAERESKENSQEKEIIEKESENDKPSREATPVKGASKEGTPVEKEEYAQNETELTPPGRDKSEETDVNKEAVEAVEEGHESKRSSKENSPVNNAEQNKESLEDAVENETDKTSDNPSEALIQSEQAASVE